MTKAIIALLLIIGVVLIVCGLADDAWRLLKRNALGVFSLLRANPLSVGLRMAAIVGVVGAIAAYPLILRNETKRADHAENELAVQIGETKISEAGAGLARDQLRRADELNAAREQGRREAAAVAAELERNADAEGPIADLARDRLDGLWARAASDHAAAVADYRRRNPHPDAAVGGSAGD